MRLGRRGATVVAGVAAYAWGLFLTRGGLGITPDSGNYIAGAESLRTVLQYRGMDGQPSIHWPPGYPVVLAAAGLAGLDAVTAARLVNCLALAFVAGLVFRWVRWATGLTALAAAAFVTCLASAPLVLTARNVWSEPLFIAISAAGIYQLARWDGARVPWPATVTLAAASIVRIAGAPFLVLPPLLVLIRLARPWRTRVSAAAACAVLGVAPLLLFAARNTALGFPPLGVRGPSGRLLGEALVTAARTGASWFLPWRLVLSDAGLVLAFAIAVLATVYWLATERSTARGRGASVALVALCVYTLFMAVSSVRSGSDPPDQRIMAPASVLALVLVCTVTAGLWQRYRHVRLAGLVLPVAIGAMLGLPVIRNTRAVTADYELSYNGVRWRDSEVGRWAGEHLRDQLVFSDHHTALFVHQRLMVYAGPRRHPFGMPTTVVDDLQAVERALGAGRCVYFVRFDERLPRHLYSTEDLERLLRATTVNVSGDGRVLEACEPPGTPRPRLGPSTRLLRLRSGPP